ncbi:MAG: phage integrase N-terminal SAM-like domain-containing protein [Actinomycetota bacterium]|nr:phage integrase N-terminal SAM-like domain-containing protein [Actinomycetota bacterium]
MWRWRPWNGTGCSTWRSQNKASSTQRIYSTAARQLIDFLDSAGRLRAPEALTKRDIEAFMEHMTTTRSASTPPKGQDTANLLDPPVQRRAGHRAVDRPSSRRRSLPVTDNANEDLPTSTATTTVEPIRTDCSA